MKKKVIFVFALFLTLTGFRGEERIVEQSNESILGWMSARGEKPKIAQGLHSITVEEGKSAEFTIKLAVSDGKYEVVWYKDAQIIEADKVFKISFDGEVGRLSISKVDKSYEGTYKVVVTNEYGREESSAKLTVTKKESY